MTETIPELVRAYAQAGSGALRTRASLEGSRIVTLGPIGTSGHEAAEYLQSLLSHDDDSVAPTLELYPTFNEVLDRTIADGRCLALVPSAYNGATTFHWHSELSLLFYFVRKTPRYGLAARGSHLGDGPIRVAAMAEVEQLFDELAPPHIASRAAERIAAHSTRHAADLVARGAADVAVTNDSSRSARGLEWISSRQGVDIVWLIFGRATPDSATLNSSNSNPAQKLEEIA